jgi:hypothetical protein
MMARTGAFLKLRNRKSQIEWRPPALRKKRRPRENGNMQLKWSLGKFRAHEAKKTAAWGTSAVLVLTMIGLPLFSYCLSNLANVYLEKRIVAEFNKTYPSSELTISGFRYNLWKNRIACDALAIRSPDSGFSGSLGKFWLSGVGWLYLITKGKHPEKAFLGVAAQAQDVSLKFPHSDYGLDCERLTLFLPRGEITAAGVGVGPRVKDEQYFAARKFRDTRFRLKVSEIRVDGLAVEALLTARGYQARSLRLRRLWLDALVDNYVPVDPDLPPARMPNELLNSSNEYLRIASLELDDGKLKYAETYAHGATPARVVFDHIQLRATGIVSQGKRGEAAQLHGEAVFMEKGRMTLDLMVPLASRGFSLQYSGSLGPMDLTRLNPFLEHSEYLRIDSGVINQTITFKVQAREGHAAGAVKAPYQDLAISFLNNRTGSSRDLMNEMKSFMTNRLKLRGNNLPDRQGELEIGRVNYQRRPQDTFIQFLWFSLRSGVLDIIFKRP